MIILLILVTSLAHIDCVRVQRAANLPLVAGSIDTSFCAWSDWTVCSVESVYRCSKSQTLNLLPLESQSPDTPGAVACNGNAGQVTSQTCHDENCPQWVTGEWTDCSNTCGNPQLPPWQGYQTRSLVCQDATGVSYQSTVCEGIYGLSAKPLSEQVCACSHQAVPYVPYGIKSIPAATSLGNTFSPTTIIPIGNAGYVVLMATVNGTQSPVRGRPRR